MYGPSPVCARCLQRQTSLTVDLSDTVKFEEVMREHRARFVAAAGVAHHPCQIRGASDPSHPQPRVINTDQARLYGAAIAAVKEEGTLRRRCGHRPAQYLNNLLEQDHRAIKRRVKAKQSFREFRAAQRTIAGYEAIHMIRKGQARWVSDGDVCQQNQFIDKLFDLAA